MGPKATVHVDLLDISSDRSVQSRMVFGDCGLLRWRQGHGKLDWIVECCAQGRSLMWSKAKKLSVAVAISCIYAVDFAINAGESSTPKDH